MTKKITNLPASVHVRLARIAKDNRQTFEQVFYIYALERFLYRLLNSEYAPSFVLKGALMFLGWGLPLRRLTKDIDLQGYTSNDVDNLVHIMRQACIQEVEPDGMRYDPRSVNGETIIEEELITLIGSYNKSNLDTSQFLPHVEHAIERARSLDKHPEHRWPNSLGTRAYLLAENIIIK